MIQPEAIREDYGMTVSAPKKCTNPVTFGLPRELNLHFLKKLEEWEQGRNSIRLREGDSSLWTGKDENKWLGWLTILDKQKTRLPELHAFGTLVHDRKFSQVVILGMGGSSLCTEVLAKTFAPSTGYPRLRILDSTNPDQIVALEKSLDLDRTLFIVSSKSGTTLEPNIFRDYFYGVLQARLGSREAATRFVAITDPNSELERSAVRQGFLRVFHGDPSIGGRYSALSDFGMVPVAGEEIGPPEVYGDDRQFYYLRLKNGTNAKLDQCADSLIRSGHPLVRIDLDGGVLSIGQEFFRWEFATAVAGSVLGINPFDQPDVEAAKVEANKLMAKFDLTGTLLTDWPFFQEGSLSFYYDPFNRSEATLRDETASRILRRHLALINPGDYFALLAFIEMNPKTIAALETLRIRIRDQKKVATCIGFGPRFLHSTGQAYKGGPNTGVFLQLTSQPKEDLPIPGHRFTFGTVQAAQPRGDFEVLVKRGRRILRIDLGSDVLAGLDRLKTLI